MICAGKSFHSAADMPRAAAQGEEHHKLEHGKAAACLLNVGLRVPFLVFAGVGPLRGGGIGDLDGPTVDLADRADSEGRGTRPRPAPARQEPETRGRWIKLAR